MKIHGIPVVIKRELGSWIIKDRDVNMYGIYGMGSTTEDATEDYGLVIEAYYEALLNCADKLCGDYEKHLVYLRGHWE